MGAQAAAGARLEIPQGHFAILGADREADAFRAAIRTAAAAVAASGVAVIGVAPTEPATGYGYIKPAVKGTHGAVKVLRSTADTSDIDALGEGFLTQASDAEWNALLKATKLKRYPPREPIVNAGDSGRQLYILLSGRAEVSVLRGDGRRQQIAVIEPGSVFGEQAFLDGQPRSATVSAISECEVRSLAWRDFLVFREKQPLVACEVLSDIGRTLSLRGRRQLREWQFLP